MARVPRSECQISSLAVQLGLDVTESVFVPRK